MIKYTNNSTDISPASKLKSNVVSWPFAAAFALAAMPGMAQVAEGTFEEIDSFNNLSPFGFSEALGISGDGAIVVGRGAGTSPFASGYVFDGSITQIDPTNTYFTSFVEDASFDGSIVVGSASSFPTLRAFNWTSGGGFSFIPIEPGLANEGNAISGDGNTAVGTIFAIGILPYVAPLNGINVAAYDRGFVWDITGGTVQVLDGFYAGGFSRATGVNSDGSIIVGSAQTIGGQEHAFRATSVSALQDLGTIDGAAGNSFALGVSADGGTVVGQSVGAGFAGERAFRWTQADGMVHLVAPGEASLLSSVAEAASADGSYVAGTASGATLSRAIWWDADGLGLDIGDLTSDNSGWSVAKGISDDGSIVVGSSVNDDSVTRGFIWRTMLEEEPDGIMLDHVNTLIQVANSAASQAAGITHIANLARFTLGQGIEAPRLDTSERFSTKGMGISTLPFALRIAAGASRNPDDSNATIAGLSAATALRNDLTLGGYIGLGSDDGTLGDFGIDGNFTSYGLFLSNGAAKEGLTWKIAAAHTGADVDITRSTVLANTETGTGGSEMSARAASIRLGYGLNQGGYLVSPFLQIRRSVSTRDAYTETNAVAFPVSYDELVLGETTATLGADVDFSLSQQHHIKLSAGLEWDLSRSDVSVTGTSDIPGMTTFDIAGPPLEHEQRLFLEARYTHELSQNRAYDLGLGIEQTPYSDKPSVMATVGYQMNF